MPDGRGDSYKAELVLRTTRDRTLRINLWYLPDLRGGERAQPHSHPWDFHSHILLGGYSEDRYALSADGMIRAEHGVEHGRRSVNNVPCTVYHEVTEIHEPARTLTLMVCGRRLGSAWGYLDTATGRHIPIRPDPDFAAKQATLNPHQMISARWFGSSSAPF